MKKSLIALAVAATVATPMAASAATLQAAEDQDAINLYGSLRPQFVSGGDESVGDGTSRFGIMGDHDLGNGLSSFYRLEQKVSTATANFPTGGRLAYAGLKGGFGAVAGGQQWSPYYTTVASPNDIFASNGLANYNETPGAHWRPSNALSYALPSGLAVGGAIAIVVNGDVTDADGNVLDDQDAVDAVSAGLSFGAGPASFGLGYYDESSTGVSRLGLTLGADMGPVNAKFMIEDVDGGDDADSINPWAITLSAMGFGLQFASTDADDDDQAVTLGYTYKVSGNTRVQFSWENNDWTDDDKFVARYRVDF